MGGFDEAFEAAQAELSGSAVETSSAGAGEGAAQEPVATPADKGGAPDAAAAAPASPAELKAHEHWSKEAKEAWAAAYGNPEHRKYAEAWRKEHDNFEKRYSERQSQYDRLHQEHQQARGFLEQFHAAIAPYAQEYQRAGMSPIAGVQRALAWEAYIRENPQQAILQLAQQAGVDLAQAQAEIPYEQQQQAAIQQLVAQQLQPLQGFVQQQVQMQQQAVMNSTLNEIQSFKAAIDDAGNPKYPFFDDVVGEMQGIVDLANARGQPITLEQAYKTATRLSESVWAKQQEQEKARAEEQAKKDAELRRVEALKARNAGGARSPVGNGATPGPDRPKTAMDAVRMAEKELGG